MDLESLMDAALVYGTGIDNTWSFIFTVTLASVGFLATLRQVFSPEHRREGRYSRLVLWVQIGLFAFLLNGFYALLTLFQRQNAVFAAIQEKARDAGAKPELIAAFEPYAIKPEWLASCPAEQEILCAFNLPISLLAFAAGAFVLILLMPLIAGRER